MDIGDMIGLAAAGTIGAVAGQSGKIRDGVRKLKTQFSLREDNSAIGQLAKLKKLFPKTSAEELIKLLEKVNPESSN